jgi:hypothetical protein
MGGVLTRWSIGHDRTVSPEDCGPDGLVTPQTLGAWVDAAVQTYLDQCGALQRQAVNSALTLTRQPGRLPKASLLGQPTDVLVTASATEVRPAEFVISIRVRPFGGDMDLPLNVTCLVFLEDPYSADKAPLDTAVRDELIALEHAAHHMN